MRFRWVLMLVAVAAMSCVSTSFAQPGGRGGPGGGFTGGGGFGMSKLALLRIPAVQKELELLDDQIEAIEKFLEEQRKQREERGGFRGGQGQRGEGQRGEGEGRGRRTGRGAPSDRESSSVELPGGQFFVQAERQGGRQRPQMSDEDRQKMMEEYRKRAEERTKLEKEKLSEILLPHQQKRLNEIYLQMQGMRALQNAEVAKELKITERQQEQMREAATKAYEGMREQMREMFQSGDRDKIREKMTAVRKDVEKKVMDVLNSGQKKKFEQMKGEPFEMPEGAMFGGGRGPGGGQGRGPGGGEGRGPGGGQGRGPGGGEGRPQRPSTDDA